MAARRKIKTPIDPDTRARQSMAQMDEIARLIRERIGAKAFEAAVMGLPDDKRREVFAKLARLEEIRTRDKCRLKFSEFANEMWPGLIPGAHFDELDKLFHRIDGGEPVRAIVCMPPRMGKSERLSYLFPSWYIGKHPDKQIIQASNVKSLATKFGGNIRNLINSEGYKKVFPGIFLAADSSAKGDWKTNKGGIYYSVGAGGTVVGRGANLLIIDDPHSEQSIIGQGEANAMPSKEDFEKVYNWFTSIRGRLEPSAAILIVMQRWAPFDLVGRLMNDMKLRTKGDQWEIIELPALLEKTGDDDQPVIDADGQAVMESLWPQRWPVEELLKLKATLPTWKWNAQYMQDPKSDESAIIKREFWVPWGQTYTKTKDGFLLPSGIDHDKKPPDCEFIIQSWDTAYTAKTRSDYSACTTWGVFQEGARDRKGKEKTVYKIILLEAARWKCEFQDLKRYAVEQYEKHTPDICIIEAKAAGLPLISEMRKAGIPVSDYTPTSRSGDKFARVNAISDLFASKFVYIPMQRPWAEDVIEEFALFPNGEHDDYVDSATQALLRFRMGGFASTMIDEEDEEVERVARKYY